MMDKIGLELNVKAIQNVFLGSLRVLCVVRSHNSPIITIITSYSMCFSSFLNENSTRFLCGNERREEIQKALIGLNKITIDIHQKLHQD